MNRVFLDANYYIDITKREKSKVEPLRNNLLFISPLSSHILFYTRKLKVPDKEAGKLQKLFGIVPLAQNTLEKSLEGPTKNLEDNIQLHSAAEAECDYFLTNDKSLLKMKFFGKTKIVKELKS
jgi:hypothetical protein